MGHSRVLQVARSDTGNRGAHIFDCRLFGFDPHAEMTGTAKHHSFVAVFLRAAGSSVRMARLRNFLVNDAIELFLHEQVVVAVEHNADTVFDQQLMDRSFPPRAVLGKPLAAIGIFATPFHVWCGTDAAPHIPTQSADEMVDENKLERRFACFQG